MGSGVQEPKIKSLIAASGCNVCSLVGFVPDIRDVYWASDIVILPSRNEGFASVIAEAMAAGCAAIRTPSGGCTDQIIEGSTGYTVDFNNPRELADRIKDLSNPETLQRVRKQAIVHAQHMFSAQRMGAETLALYKQVINND